MLAITAKVNKLDRDKLLRWAKENTSVTWHCGHSPWPCIDLERITEETWICCSEDGLFSILLGTPKSTHWKPPCEPKVMTPYVFCVELKKHFPKEEKKVRRKKRTDKQLSLR